MFRACLCPNFNVSEELPSCVQHSAPLIIDLEEIDFAVNG